MSDTVVTEVEHIMFRRHILKCLAAWQYTTADVEIQYQDFTYTDLFTYTEFIFMY